MRHPLIINQLVCDAGIISTASKAVSCRTPLGSDRLIGSASTLPIPQYILSMEFQTPIYVSGVLTQRSHSILWSRETWLASYLLAGIVNCPDVHRSSLHHHNSVWSGNDSLRQQAVTNWNARTEPRPFYDAGDNGHEPESIMFMVLMSMV